MAEPVERRLSPEQIEELRLEASLSMDRDRVSAICNGLAGEVDALRAERDTQRIRADLSVELHRQAIEEIADRTAELAMLEAERDAESSPSRTGRYKAASDRLAALFHDDQPADAAPTVRLTHAIGPWRPGEHLTVTTWTNHGKPRVRTDAGYYTLPDGFWEPTDDLPASEEKP